MVNSMLVFLDDYTLVYNTYISILTGSVGIAKPLPQWHTFLSGSWARDERASVSTIHYTLMNHKKTALFCNAVISCSTGGG